MNQRDLLLYFNVFVISTSSLMFELRYLRDEVVCKGPELEIFLASPLFFLLFDITFLKELLKDVLIDLILPVELTPFDIDNLLEFLRKCIFVASHIFESRMIE